MTYRTPRFRTRTKVIFSIAIVSAIVLPIVGPFTFYASLWPHLSPVLPRPEAVPKGARAGYNWKGPGTFWYWEQDLPSGCASWSAAGDGGYIRLVVSSGQNGCVEAERPYIFSYFDSSTDVNFGFSGSFTCSRYTADLPPAQWAKIAQFVEETKSGVQTNGEKLVIAYAEQFLNQPEPAPGEHPCGARYRQSPSDDRA